MNLCLPWTIFTIEVCHVLCEKFETIRNTINEVYGYDCQVRPIIGEILFWKIFNQEKINCRSHLENVFDNSICFTLQEYIPGKTQLQSNETYLILKKMPPNHILFFYWLGSQALLDDKREAAKYSIQHYMQLNSYFKLTHVATQLFMHREREAIESELFQYTIIGIKGEFNFDFSHYNYETATLFIYPKMYVVRGIGSTTRIKKVPMNPLWLKNDACIILATGYIMNKNLKMYFYCGAMKSAETYDHARRLASYLPLHFRTYPMKAMQRIDITHSEDSSPLKLFIELLEDQNYYKHNEFDDSNDYLKDAETFIHAHDAGVSLHRFSIYPISIINETSLVILERGHLTGCIIKGPLSYEEFKSYEHHILNTNSINGVFVKISSSQLKHIVMMVQHAEEYVHNIESNASKAIPLHIDGGMLSSFSIHTVDMKINFIEFPLPNEHW